MNLGKKRSIRIQPEQVDEVRRDLEAYGHFKELIEEVTDLTEQMSFQSDISDSKKNTAKSKTHSRKT